MSHWLCRMRDCLLLPEIRKTISFSQAIWRVWESIISERLVRLRFTIPRAIGARLTSIVPSPAVNVICANMARSELAPLIYTEWPYARTSSGALAANDPADEYKVPWVGWKSEVPGPDEVNTTVVDEVFRWGKNYTRQPPVFPTVNHLVPIPKSL